MEAIFDEELPITNTAPKHIGFSYMATRDIQ